MLGSLRSLRPVVLAHLPHPGLLCTCSLIPAVEAARTYPFQQRRVAPSEAKNKVMCLAIIPGPVIDLSHIYLYMYIIRIYGI